MEISITSGVNLKVLIRVKYRKKLSVNRFNWSFFSTFAQKITSYSSFLIRKSDCYVLEISTSKSIGCGLMQESKDIQLVGSPEFHSRKLWFDVGIKRYTTNNKEILGVNGLWFDVGIKRYTTITPMPQLRMRCGLMQESKDIQQGSM